MCDEHRHSLTIFKSMRISKSNTFQSKTYEIPLNRHCYKEMYGQKFSLDGFLKKVGIYDVMPNEKTVVQIIFVVII